MALPVGPAAPAETSSSAVVGSLSAFILKRAKAVHKKLQRITSYETQDKATLNADQVRAVASKPTLEAVYAELNAILAQTQQHEANARSQAEAELARLTDLVNANAQRADEANAQLSFLLQFLHLYSLFHHDSAVNAVTPQPDVPAALAATVTSADIHALNPVLYAFANAPLSGTAPDDSETALGIIKRVKESDSSEIVFSASSSASSIPAGITHARLAELVKALTAAPPIPTQFGALDSNDLESEPTAPVAPSAEADAAAVADDATPVPASSSDPATTAENDVVAQDSDQAPTFLNFDADKGFSLGSGPVPPSAGGRILFMQASEVEGETEAEPEQIAEQLPNESSAPDTTTTPSAQASLPIPEPAETIEPEGGAVDGAPVAEDLPASQADPAAPETTIPPVLHDSVAEPQSSSAATMPTEPATPAEAAPVQPKKIDWASLDSDDDAAIQDEVLRSSVLSLVAGHEKAAESAPQVAPVAAEAEGTRHVKQVGKTRAGQSASNTPASASGPNSSNGPKSGRGTGRTSDSAPAQAPAAPLRKPEPIVDEDGFVLHTTKKTLRQQQLAAQQESQQNRSGGSGRGGGGGRGGGARMGRGGGGGAGAGGRKERREGSGSAEVKEGAVEGASNGHGRERSSGGGGAGRSGSGTGTGRGAGAASGTGAGGNSNGTAARGRGRGRPSNAGGRQGSANPAAASSAPVA
ncbi:hypothetical protein A4X13_0g101 [Tilletia indica]|uniref:Uncharacterized protein n=1 Tax=Tilletia indica TaxID=43049 RepID=A0A177TQZ4_9BASI|nr:hypothetical protein A4X13_0g101 [Tilletia indica]